MSGRPADPGGQRSRPARPEGGSTMEAKVDVRKLQLLNDRIAQTIEALNQVRLSVYGLSHTPGLPPTIPYVPSAVPFPGYGAMTPGFTPYQGIFPGLQHTPYTPVTQFPQFNPFVLPNITGFTPPFMGGLSHTSPELFDPRFIELKPFDGYRMAQTFPNINTPYWPTW
jgi:hypothetical protein